MLNLTLAEGFPTEPAEMHFGERGKNTEKTYWQDATRRNRSMGAIIERWYPRVIGFLFALTYLIFFRDWQIPDSAQNLLLAIVSISAISVGFLATTKSILISIDQKRIIEQLRRVGYYQILVNYIMGAVRWSFALSILSAICLLMDWKQMTPWNQVVLAVWLFVLATALLSCYRVIHIFGKLLRVEDRNATRNS